MDSLPSAPSAPPETPEQTIARLTAELREARDQRAATTQIIEIINRSPGDLAPVFDAILEKAHTLCNVERGALMTFDGETFRARATRGMPEDFAAFLRRGFRPLPVFTEPLARGEHLHIHDLAAFAAESSPATAGVIQPALELAGTRTIVTVPLCRDGVLLGYIAAYRTEVRPFSDKQIALLQNFAAHAVIAMENARLLTETREALDQQTATAEVLGVINSSPGDLTPVFDAILEKAHTLCGAAHGALMLLDGETARAGAMRGMPEPLAEFLRNGYPILPGGFPEKLVRGEPFVHIHDVAALAAEAPEPLAQLFAPAVAAGNRTLLMVPLRKDSTLLGYLTAGTVNEVRPFTDKQIALLQNFAAQAVIAMENARLLTETREALEQQTATAEVLQVINSSPGDLAPVFEAMLEKAINLCQATFGALWSYDGEHLHVTAVQGAPPEYGNFLKAGAHRPTALQQRLLHGGPFEHIADLTLNKSAEPLGRAGRDLGGIRTLLAVPLCKDDKVLGIFGVYRQEVRPFSEKQIALLQNFAAQAVIAMENARLLTETREALEQQTATAEVLQVINSSPGELTPVFDAILEKAHTLCDAEHGALATYDGEYYRAAALHGMPKEFAELLRQPFRPAGSGVQERLLQGEHLIHIPDAAAFEPTTPIQRAAVDAGVRTLLMVPLRKDHALLGFITAHRREVRPFTEKQIALLQNFAAQAVIAMENARLLTETREALEQQTATTEVLQVINSSPGELTPVFDAMLDKAAYLCEAPFGSLFTYDGECFQAVALRRVPPAFAEILQAPFRPEPGSAHMALVQGEPFAYIEDVAAAPRIGPARQAAVEIGGARTLLGVPLVKDGALLGAFMIYRQEVRPFTDKQIALLQNFAAQAVIAMENARLLTETREALEQQTATAEVLQVINSSPGDLAPVFDAMLDKAIRLCGGVNGVLWTLTGDRARLAGSHGVSPETIELLRRQGESGEHPLLQRVIAGEHLFQFDLAEHEAYRSGAVAAAGNAVAAGVRTVIFVALVKDGAAVGAFVINRLEARPFSDREIALLQNFAVQAVIAMQNARLITETREALEQQTATAEVLQVINSSPGDLVPVFDAILEKAHTLCDAAYGSLALYDGDKFRAVAVNSVSEAFAERLREGVSAVGNRAELLLHGAPSVHIPDMAEVDHPMTRMAVELTGARTSLAVPLRKDNVLLGIITAVRQEVRPFSEKQIALLQNFGAQAVIAMENARLLTETREALEQQTATAEVLQVINSSPGDLAPVFDAMLEKAIRLCEADFGLMLTVDGAISRIVAERGVPEPLIAFLEQHSPDIGPDTFFGRAVLSGSILHTADMRDEAAYRNGQPLTLTAVDLADVRALLMAPLIKDADVSGVFAIFRREARPFTEKQIALLQNFAAQAVIAMENARLLTETREALEQQTATTEVLQVINSSPGDLSPVFDAILEKAHSLCGVARGSLELYDGENLRAVATRGWADDFADQLRQGYPASDHPATRPLIEGRPFSQILDVTQYESPFTRGARSGARTLLCVPLRRDDRLLGIITSGRVEIRPFTDKQIALLQNFAAQAVIAMENARLLTETREALEQQTATAEVLQVINSSPGDLMPVFDAILEKAHTLCGAAHGSLQLYDGDTLRAVVTDAVPDEFADILRQGYRAADSPASRELLEGKPFIQIPDCAEIDHPVVQSAAELVGIRTLLVVPLRRDGTFLGLISAARLEVRPFADKQIALLQNFAAQAVIAMENARLLTETREALEQQTATAEVLQVINSSPGDLAPVFDAILEKAHALCGAASGALAIYEGEHFRAVATHGLPEQFTEMLRQPFPSYPGAPYERLLQGERLIHIADQAASEQTYPVGRASVEAGGRTLLFVPLRKDGTLLGYITAARQEVRPFTDKQIALLQNFAAQAVIAMENARLITETREALEQQTATAEVLGVINSSPGDLVPVFDAMLEKGCRLCEFDFGLLWVFNGEVFRAAASYGAPGPYADFLANAVTKPFPGTVLGLIAEGEQVVHVPDVAPLTAYHGDNAAGRALVELGKARTVMGVALRKDGRLLGVITAYRQEVRPFTIKQIALLENFAAQAVIAMENARLINETREALEQQTATAEVLQVINSSPGDLAPVFDAMLEKAMHLCEAAFGDLGVFDGEQYRWVAAHGVPDFTEYSFPLRPNGNAPTEQLTRGEKLVHLADVRQSDAYREFPAFKSTMDRRAVRSLLVVPLRKDGSLLGAIRAYRREVRPFSDKQIALMQNFAAQAVIAMENARLINETRESLEQQTATAELLQVINSSPGDLAPVFEAILEKAHVLCGAVHGVLVLRDGENFRAVGARGLPEAFAEQMRKGFPGAGNPVAQPLLDGAPFVQLPDASQIDHPVSQAAASVAGIRTVMAVPLHKGDALLGYIVAARREVRLFTEKQIALLQNFAAQAVIAMENARLLTETREALEQQTATAEVLQVINSSPGDLAPVFDTILEKAHTLCEAEKGSLNTYDGDHFRAVATRGLSPEYAAMLRAPQSKPPGSPPDRLLRGETIVQVPDASVLPFPIAQAATAMENVRTILYVPLRKDTALLGYITVYRQEVRPFTDKQIALLENFAAQAVIAMENARLITETREALDQQTATAEVLGVINSSPGELAPVFDAMLERATRLCEAEYGILANYDGDRFHGVAAVGFPMDTARALSRLGHPPPNTVLGRLERTKQTVQMADISQEPSFAAVFEINPWLRRVHTALSVPLLKEGELIGAFSMFREEVRPFSDKQIALLQNFAAQAVIAMENARLLTETREALEQQTATAEVLQVINSSPGDLAPVFDSILEKAHSLCGFDRGQLQLCDGEYFRAVSTRGLPDAVVALFREPTRPAPGELRAQLLAGARYAHSADLAESEGYRSGARSAKIVVDIGGTHSVLWVPLRKDGILLGAISAGRTEVKPFSDKEIRLLENFAAQAVIAMENARLITETREALEQQTATAEVLGVINSSPGDLAPVFDAMLEKATRLCEAPFGTLRTWDGERFHFGAVHGDPQLSDWVRRRGSFRPDGGPLRRIMEGEQVVQIADASSDSVYSTSPGFREMVEASGMRSGIAIALRKDEALLGSIHVYRQEVRPFSDKQIALLQNFAVQAVIAMENARLLTETREALEQQTATAEVLQVINSSPGDLAPVFDAILEKAHNLCGASYGGLLLLDAGVFRLAAVHADEDFAEFWRQTPVRAPEQGDAPYAQLISGREVVHIADVCTTTAYRDIPVFRQIIDTGGIRTLLTVALRRDGVLLGVITAFRREVRPFSDKQIALLQNFAAQAVIAMENARLINETREALEQQTATAEVLQVINSSPGELVPVFDAMLEKAHSLCGADNGSLMTYDGERFWPVTWHGMSAQFAEARSAGIDPNLAPSFGRIVRGERLDHIHDMVEFAAQMSDEVTRGWLSALIETEGIRTQLIVALRKDDVLLGAITANRKVMRPFTDKQIALLENFAAQAVIAMENARLLTETREALEQQTATAEVLQVVNSSPGDLTPVFDAMLEKAMRLCDGRTGNLWTFDGERAWLAGSQGLSAEVATLLRNRGETGTHPLLLRIMRGEHLIQIPDLAEHELYRSDDALGRAAVESGMRSLIWVALVKDGAALGAFVIGRTEAKPFRDQQVALLQNFAAQAVIAIENTRLIDELRERTELPRPRGPRPRLLTRPNRHFWRR
jgi:GAF domain-containing protein